jgi:hypothetical protein
MNTIPLTNTQEWFRDYSKLLFDSFNASGRLKHAVTKGESRESQILDALSKLLPTRISVETNVVIVNSSGTQSPKFDGVLINRTLWPRIFASDYTVVMVESVLAGIEVKSSLDKAELDDIFGKSSVLRGMRNTSHLTQNHPFVTAFAYDCANTNLSFFDFATSFIESPDYSPSMICILNRGLFGLADTSSGKTIPADEPTPISIPVLYQPREDTLQVYIYFLSRWITADTGTAELFRQYSDNLFSQMTSFSFDIDFLTVIAKDIKARFTARDCFLRKASVPIEELYTIARKALGL